MAGAEYAKRAGLPLQVNTVFAKWNSNEFEAMAKLVEGLGVVFWEIFFLVPTGRGADMEGLSPQEFEAVFSKIYQMQKKVSFIIKVTEAPHYRRYVAEKERLKSGGERNQTKKLLAREVGPGGSIGQAQKGVNSGKGFMFVSHTGDVFPSGFLPVSAGNIRNTPLSELYRDSKLFKELRNPSLLKGRCNVCLYNDLCGGSRARAYALTEDYLEEDISCLYDPTKEKKTGETHAQQIL
jgi:radical SAM protein with 4Fe4S-binding SPASM domain